MPVAHVNNIDVAYEWEGAGEETIVFVGGTGTGGAVWSKYQVPHFAPRYRCLTYDLRGTGASSAPVESYSVVGFAEDMAALLDELGVGDAHMVGLSLGSAIIQELALARPELVRSAVLLSTWSCTAREHHIRRWFEARLAAIESGPPEVFRAFSFWMWAPSVIDFEPDRTREIEQFFGTVTASQPTHAYANHFKADLGHDTVDRLGAISCPTLVLYGSEDLITLPWYNRTVAEHIPGAEIEEITGAGHLAWLERPEQVNAAIDRFLASPRLRPSRAGARDA
jgi:pimeloyl-ACP methyl ester carboxylesterase